MDKTGVGAVGGKEGSCVPLVGVALLCLHTRVLLFPL